MVKLIARCFSYRCVMENIKQNRPDYFLYKKLQDDCKFLEDMSRGELARKIYCRAKLDAYNDLSRLVKREFELGVIREVGHFVNFCPICEHALFWRRYESNGESKEVSE